MPEYVRTPDRDGAVFTWGSGNLVFGVDVRYEAGYHAARLGARRALIVTDPGVLGTDSPQDVARGLADAGIDSFTYSDVVVEPTEASLVAAADAVAAESFDLIVAVGGGSVIDTAKAINVLATSGGSVLDYVNPPVGKGLEPRGSMHPLIAVPTTAGSGSEASAVCVMDLVSVGVKSAISHPSLRPTLSLVDPATSVSMPREVTVASGLDVLCHALESLTSRPHTARELRDPELRPVFCGANPLSDPLCERALALVGRAFRLVVDDGNDLRARTDMMLAATLTAVGSSTAGVHIPHACSYAIATAPPRYQPVGYPDDHAFVPHGYAVAVTAPSTFRMTFESAPELHLRAAELLSYGAEVVPEGTEAERLPGVLIRLMQEVGAPSGLEEFGYGTADIGGLAAASMQQQRLLAGAPIAVGEDDLNDLLRGSLTNW